MNLIDVYPQGHCLRRQTELVSAAQEFVGQKLYSFSELERQVLRPFFSNIEGHVFFVSILPPNVTAALLAMYSRLKNKRGLRGLFVDSFVPQMLSSLLDECIAEFGGNGEQFLKARGIKNLGEFHLYSQTSKEMVNRLTRVSGDAEMLNDFASGEKVKRFLATWLDKYGHNSIARLGSVSFACEQISILAAKSLEWARPGAGYIELSTRYVDMAGKDCYPIERELEVFGLNPAEISFSVEESFNCYRELQMTKGAAFSGPFPQFLRDAYHKFFPDEKDLENGVIGETCDVLGNFLPAATLTSVGITVSGEALPQVLKCLLLDATPENIALAQEIINEGEKTGARQFIRHFEPSAWETETWAYLPVSDFPQASAILLPSKVLRVDAEAEESANQRLHNIFRRYCQESDPDLNDPNLACCDDFNHVVKQLAKTNRASFDKLPSGFENVAATAKGRMSFRGWRDLHRQSFCNHYRTSLTPLLGFYCYDKPSPTALSEACQSVALGNRKLYLKLKEKLVPEQLRQYPMVMGNHIGFVVGGNLRQLEFCGWQRTKYSVNHEVRQIFMQIDARLAKRYSWWRQLSRAETDVPAYVFARTKEGIPLSVGL